MIARTASNGQTITTLLLPTAWACAFAYGDVYDLTDAETRLVKQIERDFGPCADVSDDDEFCRWHDASADGIKAANCCRYTFLGL